MVGAQAPAIPLNRKDKEMSNSRTIHLICLRTDQGVNNNDGYTHNLGEYKCVIMADDLMKLKYIGCGDRDLSDELIHTENSPGVVIDREEIE